jgi:hypothetical protein
MNIESNSMRKHRTIIGSSGKASVLHWQRIRITGAGLMQARKR